MEIIAHRGAAFDAPENSLEAFDIAIAQGAERIELDIQLSRDRVPLVNHDDNTTRTADRTVEIQFATADEVRAARLDNGEPIPTFEETCAHLRGRVKLDVELKATQPAVAEGILATMETHGFLADALITSFDPQVLRLVRQLGYGGRTGLIVGSTSLNPRQRMYEAWPFPALEEARATDLVLHHRLLLPTIRARLTRGGLGLVLWMSMGDEEQPEHRRAAFYQRIQRIRPDGIIYARIAEGLRFFAAQEAHAEP